MLAKGGHRNLNQACQLKGGIGTSIRHVVSFKALDSFQTLKREKLICCLQQAIPVFQTKVRFIQEMISQPDGLGFLCCTFEIWREFNIISCPFILCFPRYVKRLSKTLIKQNTRLFNIYAGRLIVKTIVLEMKQSIQPDSTLFLTFSKIIPLLTYILSLFVLLPYSSNSSPSSLLLFLYLYNNRN